MSASNFPPARRARALALLAVLAIAPGLSGCVESAQEMTAAAPAPARYELARRAELSRPTAHRLLSALRHEGLVDQDEQTGRWMPGPELYLMGTVAASRYDITTIARDIVRSLAVRTASSNPAASQEMRSAVPVAHQPSCAACPACAIAATPTSLKYSK